MNLVLEAAILPTLAVIFSTGILTGLSPCTLPTVVFVSAYVTEQAGKNPDCSESAAAGRWRGLRLSLAFICGIAFVLALLGLFAGLTGSLLENEQILHYGMAAVLLLMGLWLLKVFQLPAGSGSFLNRLQPRRGSGCFGAFLLGLPFGLAASPCTLPLTASILAFAAVRGDALMGALFLSVFAFGRSLPLLAVGTFSGLLKNLDRLNKWQPRIEIISGTVLIGVGLYYLWIA